MIWTLIILAVVVCVWIGFVRLNRYPPRDPNWIAETGGLFGGDGSVSDSRGGPIMPPTAHSLSSDLRAWCDRHGYRHADADVLMMDPTLTPEQFDWLHAFVKAQVSSEFSGGKSWA